MPFVRVTLTWLCCVLPVAPVVGEELSWVRVADDGAGFVTESAIPFVPWGFNYDHDAGGRLLEDYWDDEWPVVESDFQEMKALGANVVRVHLQFGRFMASPTQPRASSLEQLSRLLRLAERTGVYLDITGLGCYHRQDVPPWYDALSESDRWAAQGVFWAAVAQTCAASPAVFCYDLMNEPVVPGGDGQRSDWLGPAFGDKHFVQFIALQRSGRDRVDIARRWIAQLTQAIRRHDERHLITVGLVPWSLPGRGLTSGFDPQRIADLTDFLSVHLYPERGKLDEALTRLRGFAAAGKPVVIEEMFVLRCDAAELSRFIDLSRPLASGWMGFYWGRSPEQYRPPKTMPEAMTLSWLELFQQKTPQILPPFHAVRCAGTYPHHLQGVCTNGQDRIFWSFTTRLVATDLDGRVVKSIEVPNHHGDLCFERGRLHVAVNLGEFNQPAGKADSWVWTYDATTLDELERHPVPEVVHGAGGIDLAGDHFVVVGGLPANIEENYAWEYDADFRFVRRHTIASGQTLMGIQTAAFGRDRWWFGCYGNPRVLLVTDKKFRLVGKYEFDGALGLTVLADGRVLTAGGECTAGQGCRGWIEVAVPDSRSGLKIVERLAGEEQR